MVRLREAIALAIALAAAASAAEPAALARGQLRGSTSADSGLVFFLRVPVAPGVVAVGAAHSFDPTALAEAGELAFAIPGPGSPVAISRRYYSRPGRPYHKHGATLRDDFLVFRLEAAPRGVRLLETESQLPPSGALVRVLGLAEGAEVALRGRVVRSEATRIEVDLPDLADLRGFGGAPVVTAESGRVIGLLQSAWPRGGGLRIGVGPIGGVVEALSQPLEGGIGRLFATLAPAPSAATGHAARRRVATGSPHGDQAPGKSAAEVVAAAERAERSPKPPGRQRLQLEIEHPASESSVGDAAGVFVAGRALALGGSSRRFDIMVVIDTSGSTRQPTGVDVDDDGVVGVPLGPRVGGAEPRSSDPGDSILAAEVAAARKLLAGLDPRSTRVGLVSFAGEATLGPLGQPRVRRAALTEEPLTSDYQRLRRALEELHERGPRGMTHMAAGVDQASVELLGLEGSLSRPDPGSEKVVLFFTDGAPTLPYPGSAAGNVRAVLESATRARRAGVRIHSFAIGPEALAGPISTVEMASITEGLFTPVRDPGRLVRFMESVSFANIAAVEVVNASSGQSAFYTRVHADGSWDALVPLRPGENRLEVRARASDGAEARQHVVVRHAPGAGRPGLPAELVAKRNELLEARLAALRRDRLEVEFERSEQLRRELTLEIQRERASAVERAERQRKELQLEVQRPQGP